MGPFNSSYLSTTAISITSVIMGERVSSMQWTETRLNCKVQTTWTYFRGVTMVFWSILAKDYVGWFCDDDENTDDI